MEKSTTQHCKVLLIATIAYIAASFGISHYKYTHFLYNGLDLAIFNNVFYNLVNAGSFFSSIQGHSYLHDHFSPMMLTVLPLYALAQHPLTLLFMQSFILGATSFVVYCFVKTFFTKIAKTKKLQTLPLLFGIAWLLNPLVWNINLFEFHMIVFAPALILLALIGYGTNNFKWLVVFAFLSLLVREDISLIIFTLGIIAWIDAKPWKYRLVPMVMSLVYFLIAFWITSTGSTESFRFFIYYSWLGNTPLEIISNILGHPTMWLGHVFSLANLDMLVGLLFPFLFLPLRRPKYLLLAVLPLLQFVFGRAGGSNIVVQTHYAALFLPALLWATLDALRVIVKTKQGRWYQLFTFDPWMTRIVIIAFVVLTFVGFSPVGKVVYAKLLNKHVYPSNEQLLKLIASDKSDVRSASYQTLPHTSSRSDIYSNHYFFLGTQQFSKIPYEPRVQPTTIIVDDRDLITYWLQFSKVDEKESFYHKSIKNLQGLFVWYTPKRFDEHVVLWQLQMDTKQPYTTHPKPRGIVPVCEIMETNDHYLLNCSIHEPGTKVLFLRISDRENKLLKPFVWREYMDNGHTTALATMQLAKNQWEFPLTIETISIQGQIELGALLEIEDRIYRIDSFATTTITQMDLDA